MTTSFVLRQVEKVGGAPMQRGVDVHGQPSRFWFARNASHTLSFIDQDGTALALHVRRTSEHDDVCSDYFPGSYFSTVRGALAAWVRQ